MHKNYEQCVMANPSFLFISVLKMIKYENLSEFTYSKINEIREWPHSAGWLPRNSFVYLRRSLTATPTYATFHFLMLIWLSSRTD